MRTVKSFHCSILNFFQIPEVKIWNKTMGCIQHCPIIYIEYKLYYIIQASTRSPRTGLISQNSSILHFQNFIPSQKVHLDINIVGERHTSCSLWIFLWYSSEIKNFLNFNIVVQWANMVLQCYRTQQDKLISHELKQLFKPWFFHYRCEWNRRIARVD